MDTQLRPTGIEGVGDRPWGTHFCLFYETKADLLRLLLPYFQAGLEDHEFCLYVASEPVIAEEAERALRKTVPSFERYLAEGQVEIISHLDWYLTGGRFDPLRVRQGWIDKLDHSLARGFAGMRFAANIFWLERQDWASFGEYEGKLDEVFGQLRIMAVCAYSLEHCSATDMLDVVRHHQFTVASRQGAWERLEGPELTRALAEIRNLNADLERRVAERTAQLAGANEQLKAEITQRERSQEALRASEARLQSAIEAADIGLWDWDLVSGQVTWLGQHNALFGSAPGEFDGSYQSSERHIHPEDLQELNRVVQRAREAGSEYTHEYRIIWPDSSIHWIAGRGRFIYRETGEPVRMYGAVLDITKRKRAEEALRQSERVLREAESLGHTGSWEHDLVTGEIFNTEENLRLFFGDDRSKGAPFEDYSQAVHPDDREFVMRRHAQLLAEGGPRDIEFRVVWPDGSVHVLFGRAAVVRGEFGQAIRTYGTNLDITDRKRAEEALRRSEADYRALADNSVQGITIFQDRKMVYANPAVARIHGHTVEEFKSMSVEEVIALIHPLDRPIAAERARKRMQGEALSPSIEVRILRKDGSTGWVQAFNNPIEYQGRPAFLSTMIDITERKLAEAEIKWQATRAETLARIAARLNKELELEAVIHAVCEEAVNTFKVSQATMSLYDKRRDLLIYAGGVNIPPEYGATMEPITRTRFEDFLRAMGPIVVVPDIQAVPDVPNVEFSSQLDVRTVVTVAMLRDQELIGALVVGVNGQVREFAQDELTLLKAICDQAAQAVANAQLLKEANEQQEQLHALSAKLADAQEAERRAVARELHDEIGQLLYAVGANLQAIQITPDAATLTERLADSAKLIDDALRQIRDLALELRPSMLDDFGLVPALTWFAERQAQRSDFKVEFAAEPSDLRLAPSLETTIYRIVQIALTNVARHAQAQHVDIAVRLREAEVALIICDDGLGFDVAAALERAIHGATLGLLSMQERVRLAGGTLDIDSSPGHGTEIRARFPIGP